MALERRDLLFFSIFGLFALSAWVWLILGLGPLLAAVSGSLHDGFHARGNQTDLLGQVARNVAQAAHAANPSWQSVFDYAFSFFNLGLGLFLLKLRPFDGTARLLSIGLIGTAIAFNLQGHDALQVVPPSFLGKVETWHVGIHIVSGLCYMFALLLFPSGRLVARGRSRLRTLPLLLPLALFFTSLSLMTADDHTLGLVVVYGMFIPVTGVAAQVRRFRRADSAEQRQQSKVLLFALLFALLIAVPLVAFTQSPGAAAAQKTVTYELTAPERGTYFFRCDPHPDDMKGVAVVVPPGTGGTPSSLAVSASENRFDTNTLRLEAGRPTTIRFTNRDADLHNIALYESERAEEPIFIGQEFSGKETAVFAFRMFRLVFIVIPIALFVGLIRFHLWDIDGVVNRTLVYGTIAGIISIAYLALVVGLGTLFGAGSRMNLALSIVVTVALAATFQPLRDRARRVANRIVYGKRATPYEVLSAFSERVGNSYALEEAIPEMAKALGEGTHAKRAEVWLRVDDRLVRSASWPAEASEAPESIPLNGDELPDLGAPDRAVRVAHRGEFLGALTVTKPPGQTLTPVEDRLLQDVAAQAGLVLRNAQLAAELQARLDQLRESRQRIVAAQDAERRRLERNIHDGAQQHLVALSMKLRLAQELAATDPGQARDLLEELRSDTGDALQTLRDLARGIYPPVLADKGLIQALEAHARRCPVEVTVSDADVGRHPSEVEAAAYFCCLEAIQNAVKHAGAGPVEVAVAESNGSLCFRVTDAGPGFEPENGGAGTGIQNMRDRMAALGGTLEITSARGTGTCVEGRIPLSAGGKSRSEVEATPN